MVCITGVVNRVEFIASVIFLRKSLTFGSGVVLWATIEGEYYDYDYEV